MRCVWQIAALSLGMNTIPAFASDNQNAATWYQRATDRVDALSDEEWAEIESFAGAPTAVPSDRVRALLDVLSGARSFVLRGSRQPYSDYYSALYVDFGGERMFPATNHNIRDVPRLATLMRADALRRIHDGDNLGAAESLGATYQMARHLTEDLHPVSNDHGFTIFRQADLTVQLALDRGVFGPAESARMLRALRNVGPDDPFRATETFANLADAALRWYESLYESGQIDTLEGYLAIFQPEEDLDLNALDEVEFHDAIEQSDAVIDQVVEAMLLDDAGEAKARLREISDSIEGQLVAQLLPWLDTMGGVFQIHYAEKLVASRIETFEKLAQEEKQVQEFANAAMWYLRGIDALGRIGEKRLGAIREFLETSKGTKIEAELAEAHKEVQKALDIFRDGSLIRRCDFSPARTTDLNVRDDLVLIPTYVPGMFDAMRLLRADAARCLRAGNIESAVDRLATCYRVASHLGTDPLLVSCLTSHDALKTAILLTELVLVHDDWDDQYRTELSKAVGRMSRKDPCGYITSMKQTRERLASAFTRLKAASTDEEFQRNRQVIRKWNGDELLFGLIVLDTLRPAVAQRETAAERDSIAAATEPGGAAVKDQKHELAERLGEILSPEGLKSTRAHVAFAVLDLKSGNLSIFGERQIPDVGSVEKRRRAARRDLRRARSLVDPIKTNK